MAGFTIVDVGDPNGWTADGGSDVGWRQSTLPVRLWHVRWSLENLGAAKSNSQRGVSKH